MTRRAATSSLALCITVEPVALGHPQEGRYQAQVRWDEDTVTAYGDTAPLAALAVATKINRETWG
ncbi:hypothetical protein KZZ07_08235 [Mameliella sp. CS4]|uniref:hypothetical protein n=1 Tax=Mameliella sp. CS4 TaxID=2862329 RepID=UPI001C6017A8|nr:hypothetical protein [Mameliella sp. CS4]MBW4982526.1 hypothetical protein [Mameliella sp. CS4]